MFCMECGTKLPDGAKFCMNCGTKLGEVASAPTAPAVPAAPRGCTPGKEYKVIDCLHGGYECVEARERQFAGTEFEKYKMDYYTVLDDGSVVGWVACAHFGKYDIPENYGYYYNLYRMDKNGVATYLGGRCDHGVETTYVKDGYAYWREHLQGVDGDIFNYYKTSIYDDSPAVPAAPRGCTPGKKYEVFKIHEGKGLEDQAKYGQKFFRGTEIESNSFYCDYYTRLDDGTAVGWIYKHIKKYNDAKDYYYNLYRLDPDGTATFLGTGARSGIEDMYVQDGYAYWYGFGTGDASGKYRKFIYDNSPVEKLD